MMKDISSLPDYAALKKLASALWQQDNSYHGAAIMVGAGFSRSAASTGDASKKLPLWNHFSKKLADELGSGSTDPLRLAEEYCAYFGKQALHDLIKQEINDAAWAPGELHKSLLELPWSEILTTNWDTLLERASSEVHQPIYSVVSKQEDLSSARSPRIVKLHGTIDVTKDLVFTQEDYRKYPQQYAAFVNFSRQVFIENELCLLGFSGDDPNFLQWTGWVRDHLATHSRRIYLVGALGLNSAKRKYLESVNVAPIDLDDLVTDYDERDVRHLEATKIFVQALQDLKPRQIWEWAPTQLHRTTTTGAESTKTHQDVSYAAKLLEEKLPSLEKDRLSYPDWLVCPYGQRFQLQGHITDPWPNPKNLPAMAETSKAKLLYEITWHHQVTFEAMPSWLANELLTVCDPDKPCALSKKQQLEIAVFLLKNTRWMDNSESKNISQTTSSILENGTRYWPESSDELAYHRAIVARDQFDYATLEQHVEKITSSNPVWKLRKASLLAELGQFDKGEALVAEAYKELLTQCRNDRNSIHIISRLAWAHWLMRGVDFSSFDKKFRAFPSSYRDSKCDPWDHIEHIRERISKELDKQQKKNAIEPLFEPGRFRDNANSVSFSNELHPLLLLEGISGIVGMPLRWNGVSFLVEQAARLAELDGVDNINRFALAIRSANSDTSEVLKKVFSRVHIACLPESDVTFLLNQCMLAINYWLKKREDKSSDASRVAIDRLRIFIEVLARASVRATAEQAKQIFRLAVSLGKKPEFHHIWLFDAVKHLSKFSLKSIPESHQHDVLLDALSFPLQSEINIRDHKAWANPVVKHPGKRPQDSALDRRIDEIIDHIAPCSPQSSPALLRLLPLIEKEFLTGEELKKVTQKVWGNEPDLNNVPETGLLKYVLLEIPSPDPAAVKALVRRYLFEAPKPSLLNSELLTDIANAAQAKNIKEFPSADQAADYFEQLVIWRPNKDSNDMLGFVQNEERQLTDRVGQVLARSVVPALSSEKLTEENFQKLCAFYSEVEAPEVLIAFPYFAIKDEFFLEQVERLIRQGFQSDDPNKLAYASYALLVWRDQKESPAIDRLILRLIYLIGSSRMTGLSALLWTANQMYCKKYLSDESTVSLVEILPVIFDNAGYRNISPSGRESVSVSFVRAACVRLARDIVNNGENKNDELLRILEEAKQDALPEVRFAEMTNA
ncbi:SIR2 family NAD-dependent protein deacylase [Stutzerimonas frequens]|uniref:SIR2 family NAD-dependent protein deacylase n=1 Tax=Stutzerimonas frequens TaxID=2968969 RepID=UPI00190CB2D8|nr:SIR2 family protein [Stutzerimonas frequens]MBK3759623.1 SIR2 family protein [Stutzerimonas frequens]